MAILTNIKFHHGRDSSCSLVILVRLFYITAVQALVIILHGEMCNAEHALCNYGAQYTKGSKFESNLKTVFNSLVQHTSRTGFSTTVSGQISGLLQCRGDTTVDQCYNCSQLVTTNIKHFCGTGVGARVWFDFCFLRYENYNFIGQMGDNGVYVNVTANASNPSVSIPVVNKLWSKLSGEAASAMKRCAFGTTVDSLSRNIYAQTECTRDISSDDCTTCLSRTINYSLSNYPGSQGLQGLMSSCTVRYETYSFFNFTALSVALAESPPPPKLITPSSKYNSPHISHSHKLPLILGIVGGFLLILFVCLFATWRRLKSAIFGGRYEGHGQVKEDTLIIKDQQMVTFKMKTLIAATENFHDDNKLGEGGFGPVYKGTTHDGKEIAVKKLSLKSMQGRKEFLNEVKLVAKIRHRNIVSILGCCAEGSERLLVYEYLPNKSLDKILLDRNKHIDWQKRYNIILGVARGLLYLHQDSHLLIIHRDIKTSNILLDEKLNPKIADFGLAKLFPEDVTHVITAAAGTYGYMAPEYAQQGKLSVKVDVYSFGVVLLELVTGRRSRDYDLTSEMQTLLGWAWASYQQGNIVQMIDPAIVETCHEEQALRCIHVGLLCTQADSSLRPSMPTITLNGRAQKKAEREAELRAKFEQERKARMEKFQGANLYLKNLDDSVDDERLKELFSDFGTITSCKVMRDPQGQSRGSGFVAFSTPEEAMRAVSEMNAKMVGRKPLYVALAQRKEERRARLQAQFAQMRAPIGVTPALPTSLSAYHPAAPRLAPQQLFYGQGPHGLIPPQPTGFGYQQQLLPGIRPGMAQMPNFLLPFHLQRQGQQGQRIGGRRGGTQQQLQQQQQQQQQQLLQRNANQGYRYMHNTRNGPEPSMVPQALMGTMMPMPLDVAGMPVGNAETTRPQPVPITALASALASANPEQQRAMLGEQLFPLVDQLEHDHAGKVTGMLLEMDQTEVLHLIESPDALKAKIQEAMDVLRLAQATAVASQSDQLASLSLNEPLVS